MKKVILALIFFFMGIGSAFSAYQSQSYGIVPGDVPVLNTVANMLADANAEGAGCIAMVPKTGTVSKIWWTTGTVTTGDTMNVTLETVSGALPSGTNYGGSTVGTQVVADADDNAVFKTALGTTASVTKGDYVAMTVRLPTTGAVGNLNIETMAAQWVDSSYVVQYLVSWASVSDGCKMALEYNDGSYAPMFTFPVAGLTLNETSYNVNSTPDEIGLYFSYPFPVKIHGVQIHHEPDNGTDVVLYDSDGTTVLDTISNVNLTRTAASETTFSYFFDSDYVLAANTFYRISMKASSASASFLSSFSVDAAAVLDAFPGGQNHHWTSQTGGGGWTQTATQRPHIYPIVSQFDDGAGGGSAGGVWGF